MDRNPTRGMSLLSLTLNLGAALGMALLLTPRGATAANVTQPITVSTTVAKNCSNPNGWRNFRR